MKEVVDEIIAILRDAGGATLRERTGIWAAKVLCRHLQKRESLGPYNRHIDRLAFILGKRRA